LNSVTTATPDTQTVVAVSAVLYSRNTQVRLL